VARGKYVIREFVEKQILAPRLISIFNRFGHTENVPDENGQTLLHYAVSMNPSDDPLPAQGDLITLLFALPRKYHIDIEPIDPNFPDRQRNTALHLAAQLAQTDIIEMLLENGAYQIPNFEGRIPLWYALEHKDWQERSFVLANHMLLPMLYQFISQLLTLNLGEMLARLRVILMHEGPDSRIPPLIHRGCPETGKTLLHLAVENQHVPACQYLVSCGATETTEDSTRVSPVFLAVRLRNEELARSLLTRSPIELQRGPFGIQIVKYFVTEDDLDTVEFLSRISSDTMHVSRDRDLEESPLFYILTHPKVKGHGQERQVAMCRLLLKDIDINSLRYRRMPLIHYFVQQGNPCDFYTVQILLAIGANPLFKNSDDNSALVLAINPKRTRPSMEMICALCGVDILYFPEKPRTPYDLLYFFICQKDHARVKMLLENGLTIDRALKLNEDLFALTCAYHGVFSPSVLKEGLKKLPESMEAIQEMLDHIRQDGMQSILPPAGFTGEGVFEDTNGCTKFLIALGVMLDNPKLEVRSCAVPARFSLWRYYNSLTHVYFRHNNLTVIPDVVTAPNLKYLLICDSNFASPHACDALEHCPGLETLVLHRCNLTYFPSAVLHMSTLKELYLVDNEIPADSFSGLERLAPTLNVFACGYSGLEELPPEVFSLENLKELFITSDKITELPKGIVLLHNLETLEFCRTQSETPPLDINIEIIEQLPNLKTIALTNVTLTPQGQQAVRIVSKRK
jgi:ankyrin repeat protein